MYLKWHIRKVPASFCIIEHSLDRGINPPEFLWWPELHKVPPEFLNLSNLPFTKKIFDKILTDPLKSLINGLKVQKWSI